MAGAGSPRRPARHRFPALRIPVPSPSHKPGAPAQGYARSPRAYPLRLTRATPGLSDTAPSPHHPRTIPPRIRPLPRAHPPCLTRATAYLSHTAPSPRTRPLPTACPRRTAPPTRAVSDPFPEPRRSSWPAVSGLSPAVLFSCVPAPCCLADSCCLAARPLPASPSLPGRAVPVCSRPHVLPGAGRLPAQPHPRGAPPSDAPRSPTPPLQIRPTLPRSSVHRQDLSDLAVGPRAVLSVPAVTMPGMLCRTESAT